WDWRGKNRSASLAQAAFHCSSPLWDWRRCNMRKYEILPQQRLIGRPFCELCKSQMWFACIEPDEPGYDRRTFECPACPNVTVRIVKYRSEQNSLPPMQLAAADEVIK